MPASPACPRLQGRFVISGAPSPRVMVGALPSFTRSYISCRHFCSSVFISALDVVPDDRQTRRPRCRRSASLENPHVCTPSPTPLLTKVRTDGENMRFYASFMRVCCRSSVVEHSLGKGEVLSSILSGSTRFIKNLAIRPVELGIDMVTIF